VLLPLVSLLLLVPSAGSVSNARSQGIPVVRQRTACQLITRAGAQQALGRVVANGVETAESTVESSCEFAARGGQVTLSLHHLDAKPDMEGELRNLQNALPGAAVRRLTGFGKDTDVWMLDLGDAGVQIHLIHAEREYVMVSVLGLGDEGLVFDSARTIAHQALLTLLTAR
jgi:hypothetical protein